MLAYTHLHYMSMDMLTCDEIKGILNWNLDGVTYTVE